MTYLFHIFSYVTATGLTLIDRELYLLFDWCEDWERCRAVGIPESVRFETKPDLSVPMLERVFQARIPIDRPQPTEEQPQHLCLDKGYDYDEVRALGKEFGYTLHIRPRKQEAQEIKRQVGFKARRWVVERTHRWMNRFRSVFIRWDKKIERQVKT